MFNMALLTHTYDTFVGARGKVVEMNATEAEKAELFAELRANVEKCAGADPQLKKTAEQAINLIITNRSQNAYEKSMSADDLLYLVYKKLDKRDTLMLIEQLSDIVSKGSCPQGRVNRLMQLVDGLYGL